IIFLLNVLSAIMFLIHLLTQYSLLKLFASLPIQGSIEPCFSAPITFFAVANIVQLDIILFYKITFELSSRLKAEVAT
ncbi:MAG: hypothetical protein ACQ9MH_26815, partial [Nitrospinales bacterium]